MLKSDLEIFVLEYSPTQKSFHIESCSEMIDNNLKAFLTDKITDYIPIVRSPDREKLNQIATRLKDLRDQRRMKEVVNG